MGGGLSFCIENVYCKTSQHLLDILHKKYKLTDHMKVGVCRLGSR